MLAIVAGMPRSASTLQSNIAKMLLEMHGIGGRIEWSIDWQRELARLEQLAQDEKTHLLKTHWVEDETLSFIKLVGGRGCFLISHRDVRDVAVSMMVKFDYSFSKAKKRIAKAIENIQRLRDSGCPVLIQSYTTLRYDLPLAIHQVATFLGVEATEATVEKIVAELNVDAAFERSRKEKPLFEGLRRKLAFLLRTKFPYADDELMLHPNHVSAHKGAEGLWTSYLSDKQARELEHIFGAWCDWCVKE